MHLRRSNCDSTPLAEARNATGQGSRIPAQAAGAMMAALLLACGCSQQKPPLLVPTGPPVEWPPPPDTARVRYLGEIKGSSDLNPQKSAGQILDELFHGPPGASPLVSPYAVAVHPDGARVAIADTGASCVHMFNLKTQAYERQEIVGDPPHRFESPVAVAWAGEDVLVADARLHAVAWVESSGQGTNRKKIPARWLGEKLLKRPAGLAFCSANGLLYVADAGAHSILVFERDGKLALQFGSHGSAAGQFNCPSHLVCTADSLYVIDSLNSRAQRMGLDGSPIGMFGRAGDAAGDLALPKGVAIAPDGNLWVVDARFENVQAFTPDGKLLMAFGEEGHGPGQFWLPAGACIDAQHRLWIADSYNRRVQVFQLLP